MWPSDGVGSQMLQHHQQQQQQLKLNSNAFVNQLNMINLVHDPTPIVFERSVTTTMRAISGANRATGGGGDNQPRFGFEMIDERRLSMYSFLIERELKAKQWMSQFRLNEEKQKSGGGQTKPSVATPRVDAKTKPSIARQRPTNTTEATTKRRSQSPAAAAAKSSRNRPMVSNNVVADSAQTRRANELVELKRCADECLSTLDMLEHQLNEYKHDRLKVVTGEASEDLKRQRTHLEQFKHLARSMYDTRNQMTRLGKLASVASATTTTQSHATMSPLARVTHTMRQASRLVGQFVDLYAYRGEDATSTRLCEQFYKQLRLALDSFVPVLQRHCEHDTSIVLERLDRVLSNCDAFLLVVARGGETDANALVKYEPAAHPKEQQSVHKTAPNRRDDNDDNVHVVRVKRDDNKANPVVKQQQQKDKTKKNKKTTNTASKAKKSPVSAVKKKSPLLLATARRLLDKKMPSSRLFPSKRADSGSRAAIANRLASPTASSRSKQQPPQLAILKSIDNVRDRSRSSSSYDLTNDGERKHAQRPHSSVDTAQQQHQQRRGRRSTSNESPRRVVFSDRDDYDYGDDRRRAEFERPSYFENNNNSNDFDAHKASPSARRRQRSPRSVEQRRQRQQQQQPSVQLLARLDSLEKDSAAIRHKYQTRINYELGESALIDWPSSSSSTSTTARKAPRIPYAECYEDTRRVQLLNPNQRETESNAAAGISVINTQRNLRPPSDKQLRRVQESADAYADYVRKTSVTTIGRTDYDDFNLQQMLSDELYGDYLRSIYAEIDKLQDELTTDMINAEFQLPGSAQSAAAALASAKIDRPMPSPRLTAPRATDRGQRRGTASTNSTTTTTSTTTSTSTTNKDDEEDSDDDDDDSEEESEESEDEDDDEDETEEESDENGDDDDDDEEEEEEKENAAEENEEGHISYSSSFISSPETSTMRASK